MGLQLAATVNEVLDWYEATEVREFSPVALQERKRVWGLFRGAAGTLRLEECRPVVLLEFLAAQKGARSHWTRRRIKATVNKPFNAAAEVGLIVKNPFKGVRIPEGKRGRDWTDAEYQAILRASQPYFRRLIVFLRFSGARPGEARALCWPQVLDGVQAIVQSEHKTSCSTEAPRRIHFNDVLLKLLIWLRRNKGPGDHVFQNHYGKPWTTHALDKHLRDLRKAVGLSSDVKLHGGRHTFATHAIINGVDIATLAELLGHTTTRTTERYLHLVHQRKHLNSAMNKAIGRGA